MSESKQSVKRLQDDLWFGAPFTADHYPAGSRVRVLRCDRQGQVAVVTRTWADGGDMLHRCCFEDGQTADHYTDEITQSGH